MGKLGSLKYNDLVKILKLYGYIFARQGKGSHELWKHIHTGDMLPIPKHSNKDIPQGTLHAIFEQANINKKDLF